jgi:hypothetical protein
MERNNLLVKRAIMGIFSGFLLNLFGCTPGQYPTEKEFVGEWKSQYDEVLILNEDSTFVMKNLRSEVFLNHISGEKIDGKGTWRIETPKHSIWSLRLNYSVYTRNGVCDENGFGEHLFIRGSGLLGNKPPWRIHSFDGDGYEFSVFKKLND